jgi:DNA repair exonuclease SbcCD nuclease subunit
MRVVHLADLHLGFRQYQRLASGGVNQREADVAATFSRAVDRIIEIAPEIIVVAGDVFHVPRPANSAILFAFREFTRLAGALPNTPVIVVAGNHDTPRAIESGGILQLLEPLGVHVIDREARRLAFPQLELSVLAVPDAGHSRPALEPDPHARFNVMVLHGEVQGMLCGAVHGDRSAAEISSDELRAPSWDYVALGHYHVYREIAPNAFYSGSIDYTSSNPWGELVEQHQAGLAGKGFIERDLVTGEHRFHTLAPSRSMIELQTIDAAGIDAAELDRAIARAVQARESEIDGSIARLVVRNVSRDVARGVDQRALRGVKRRAMHFRLDLRPPSTARRSAQIAASPRTVDERMNELLDSQWAARSTVERHSLMKLARHYLALASERLDQRPTNMDEITSPPARSA